MLLFVGGGCGGKPAGDMQHPRARVAENAANQKLSGAIHPCQDVPAIWISKGAWVHVLCDVPKE